MLFEAANAGRESSVTLEIGFGVSKNSKKSKTVWRFDLDKMFAINICSLTVGPAIHESMYFKQSLALIAVELWQQPLFANCTQRPKRTSQQT